MSALSDYLTQVERLLHDSTNQFWSVSELTTYINDARKRLVRDTGAYRILQGGYISTSQETYQFGGITNITVTAGGTGYSNSFAAAFTGGGGSGAAATVTASGGVIQSIAITNAGLGYTSAPTVDLSAGGGASGAATAYFIHASTIDMVNITFYWGNSRIVLPYRPWSIFNAKMRYYVNYTGRPTVFSVYNNRTVYIQPIPDQIYQVEWDTVRLPPDLVDDTTVEVIPQPFVDPVQYFAAYLAKIKEQSWGEADAFMGRYRQEVGASINSAFTRRLKNPYAG